jgi:hypothetical protein
MMSSQRTSIHNSPVPCTWQPLSVCQACQTNGKLMCRFDEKDLLNFFMIILPFGVTATAGTIRAGYGWYLLLWLAYSLFFFFVWEARVLCRHCPYWAEEGTILHCHANYGVIKIWKYHPGPMNKWEKTQFVIGVLLWVGFPFPFLFLGQEYLLALIGVSAAVSGAFILRKNVCTRCINLSCPLNAVPKQLVDIYLRRNPDMQAAWESSGYPLEKS